MCLSAGTAAVAAVRMGCMVLSATRPGSTAQDLTDFQLGFALLQGCGGMAALRSCESHCYSTSKICVRKPPNFVLEFLQCALLLLCLADLLSASEVIHEDRYIYIERDIYIWPYSATCTSRLIAAQHIPYGPLWPEWQLPASTTYTVSTRSASKFFSKEELYTPQSNA